MGLTGADIPVIEIALQKPAAAMGRSAYG